MTRRKKTKGTKSPLIRLVGLEAAAVAAAAGMTGPPALAAPGDLDPSFGEVGRQSNLHSNSRFQQWSAEVQDDDSVLFGGGGEYCYWGCYEDYFVGRLLPNGTPDASFSAAMLDNATVYDTALQVDGRLVAVGNSNHKLQVFRLRPDGSLDPDFGLGGLVTISDESGVSYDGHSVIVDPDGRIVVAGSRNYRSLLVARLEANGALDLTFGTGGIFVASEPVDAGNNFARIARVAGGGYRVTAHGPTTPTTDGSPSSCKVFGLTATGALDAGFGTAGVAAAPSPDDKPRNCTSLVMQGDGRILLGGHDPDAGDGYLSRLLPDGTLDSGFHPDQVAAQMSAVTALGVGSGGSIFVAGHDRTGLSGALVVRLVADGTLDALFGRAGVAEVEVNARRVSYPSISDMKIVAGDALVVAGASFYAGNAFVARLLGNAAGGSPGVLSMRQQRLLGTEQDGRAVLTVRRMGGSTGTIAVSYSTRDFPEPPATGSGYAPGARAAAGADYTATTGRLTWADGDVSEREIVVPIAADTTAEKPEFFEVVLESPEGGTGFGASGADVEIAGASYPVGEFSIYAAAPTVSEGAATSFYISRDYYSQGTASVTVRVVAGGSATPGQDFHGSGSGDWQDVVLTWSDGDMGSKAIPVTIRRDDSSEPSEMFTLELASPTGGASLGDVSQSSVTVIDLPPSRSNLSGGNGRSGGGGFGWLGAMLFGLGGELRRRRIRSR